MQTTGTQIKLSLAAKKMIMVICVVAVLIMIGGAVYFVVFTEDAINDKLLKTLAFALGALLTSALNVLKVFLLERNVQRILDMTDPTSTKGFVTVQYMIRYVLTGVVLVVAALTPFINLWSAILGVLSMQIAAFALRFMKVDNDEPEAAD